MQTRRKSAALFAIVIAATAAAGFAVPSDSAGGGVVSRGHLQQRAPVRGPHPPAPAPGPLVQMTAARLARAAGHAPGSASGQPPRDQVGGPLLASRGIVVREPRRGANPLPPVPASAYVVADAGTGQVLAARDPHGLFPPASTLKVLTAIALLPLLKPDETVIASKRAASAYPNIVGLLAGHSYRVADLFRALLMISANDAAIALVEGTGSFTHGMALVNAEAHHLQAYDVVAKYPNGLPAPGQVVSAYDLALIARAALGMRAFMRYDSTLSARFPVSNRKQVTLVNQNYLLTEFRGALGGKIGWTTKAGATYIGMARRHGVTLIVTILHATPLTEIDSAEKLLSWGFRMDGRVSPVGVLVHPLAPVRTAARAHGRPAPNGTQAAGGPLPAASRGRPGPVVLAASIAGGLGAIVLAGLVWLRRKAVQVKPRTEPPRPRTEPGRPRTEPGKPRTGGPAG